MEMQVKFNKTRYSLVDAETGNVLHKGLFASDVIGFLLSVELEKHDKGISALIDPIQVSNIYSAAIEVIKKKMMIAQNEDSDRVFDEDDNLDDTVVLEEE